MSFELLMYIGLGIGVGFLVLAITLFFVLKIPAVVSELTGRTAKREIEAILSREQNEGSRSSELHKPGRLKTSTLSRGRKLRNTANLAGIAAGTSPEDSPAPAAASPPDASPQGESYDSTSLLDQGNQHEETTFLGHGGGSTGEDGTVVLSSATLPPAENATMVLNPATQGVALGSGTVVLNETPFDVRNSGAMAPNINPDDRAAGRGNESIGDTVPLNQGNSQEAYWSYDQGGSTRRLGAASAPQESSHDLGPAADVYIEDRILVVHTDELIGEW